MNKVSRNVYEQFPKFLSMSLSDTENIPKDKSDFLLHPRAFQSESESSICSLHNDKLLQIVPKTTKIFDFEKPNRVRERSFVKRPKKQVEVRKKIQTELNEHQFMEKFSNVIQKLCNILTNIRLFLEKGVPSPDGEEDFHRRTKRVQEFSSRFSRTYLYPVIRHIKSLDSFEKSIATGSLNQKLISVYNAILQALQSYYNHLPSSVDNFSTDKLQALTEQTLHLGQVQQKTRSKSDDKEYINAVKYHAELILETIKNFNLKPLENVVETKKEIKVKNKKVISNEEAIKKKNNNKKTESRFSMYTVTSSFRKDEQWKRAVESLAKIKYNVKSRYKTAKFKHRPAVEKPHIISLPEKSKLFPKRSSAILRNTPVSTPLSAKIQTLIGIENNKIKNNFQDSNSTIIQNEQQNEIDSISVVTEKILQLVPDNNEDKSEKREKITEYLNGFLINNGSNRDVILARLLNEIDDKFVGKIDREEKKSRQSSVISITGAKNAKLICIKDDNDPVIEESNEIETNKLEYNLIKTAEINYCPENNTKPFTTSKTSIKISRLPKQAKKPINLLGNDSMIKIIQYKLEFHKCSKTSHLYEKTATNLQPWPLVGRLANEILDEILLSIVQEIEVDNVLENIYHSEFQY